MTKIVEIDLPVKQVPLPPEKVRAWRAAIRDLYDMLLEYEKKQTEDTNLEKPSPTPP